MHGSLPGLAAGRFGVIMFFSACRLPSFAPEDPPSHASGNQITTGDLALRRRITTATHKHTTAETAVRSPWRQGGRLAAAAMRVATSGVEGGGRRGRVHDEG